MICSLFWIEVLQQHIGEQWQMLPRTGRSQEKWCISIPLLQKESSSNYMKNCYSKIYSNGNALVFRQVDWINLLWIVFLETVFLPLEWKGTETRSQIYRFVADVFDTKQSASSISDSWTIILCNVRSVSMSPECYLKSKATVTVTLYSIIGDICGAHIVPNLQFYLLSGTISN